MDVCMMYGRSLALGSAAGCFSVAFAFGCKGQCSYRSRRLDNISFCCQGASVALRALCVRCVAMVLSWPCVGPCALVP